MLQATVFNNPWIKVKLHPKQAVFLSLPCREALYGGAAGGGKTIALLAAALQFVDTPGYNALLLRRTYRELAMPEGIMDVAHNWLGGTAAKWNGQEHRYEFPSGATLTFGYLEIDKDKYRYQGPAFQYVGWDELTQFQEPAYRYLFSRLRRIEGVNIPLRIRAASNPGGIGHEWVKNRFFTENNQDRVFISAKLDDNPSLDRDAYKESLSALDAVTRKQLLEGNWEVRASGGIFDRSWFQIVDAAPAEILRICRGWDFAATAGGGDYTVGGRVCRTKEGVIYIENVIRGQWSPSNVEAVYLQTAQTDTRRVAVRFEQEPGASGKDVAHRYVRMLQGYDVRAIPSSGSKLSRWRPLASQAEVGNVRLVRGAWNGAFIEEMNALTADDTHPNDDQADSVCIAFNEVTKYPGGAVVKIGGF